MQSISQLIELLKSFQSLAYIFCTTLEPLELAQSIPDSLAQQLTSFDFLSLIDECKQLLERLNDHINVLNPTIAKELKKLLKHPKSGKDRMIPYADFTIDKPPLFKKTVAVQMSFDDIIKQAEREGKELKPIKHRVSHSFEGTCPYCGAPHQYIYDNNGKGQYKCKACSNTFTVKTSISEEMGIYCPYCNCKLDKKHDRKGYVVYVCPSNKCSYYKHNKQLLKEGKGEHLETSSKGHRLRYHYRDFKFTMADLKACKGQNDIDFDLNKIHFDQKVLGLVLTYYVNYGLSARKTALILREVHGVHMSHQTVLNYASKVSKLVNHIVDKYPYRPSNSITGDETYVKVRGINKYVFFFSDPVTKIILSYMIYANRDTRNACESIANCLSKFESIPDDLLFITDGNPIYNAAQMFFALNGINFTLKQVIGVKNKDETSKEYRPFKQIEERLNRTFKQNYYGTNGYHSLETANEYMVLYVAFFNFLRSHSALKHKTPVDDDLFDKHSLMPDRWLKLIQMSVQNYA